ncbi:MAG: NUDIX hydrolase [Methanomicrobiales archaeon]|nr:NUDIX hydrolase [Methanomicrobiales archaeon]MDD1669267.1 NUDIX hydrolase [Methanomicrobiales archaeon]
MTEIYRGKRLRVVKELYRLPSGREKERVVIHPGDAAAMLPIEGDSCILLRQFRFAIGEYLCEAPAGTMDPGETPVETAQRELIEETGFSGKEFISRGFIYTTPGFTTEKIHLFEVRGLSPSGKFGKDEDEEIEVVRVPVSEVLAMVRDGRIRDAKTIALAVRCLG